LFFLLFLTTFLYSEDKQSNQSNISLKKPQSISDVWLDVNRLHGVFRNNGIWHFDVVANTQGTEWPAGSGNSPIFAAGQWIAAKVNGEVRVAGIQHSATEFQSGEIVSPGIASDPKDKKYRWYELRSDGTGDWDNWPIDQGAPVDERGEPLLIGDQTIFSIWNDLTTHEEFGSIPLGVEVRQTVFANADFGVLGDMHFIKWQLVNKSDSAWDSTYFAIWMDPDLGDAGDDLVGCDTILGMGFCYNANNNDQTYGLAPPAMGIDLFQGPIVDNYGSIVTLPNGNILYDKTMLAMTAFVSYDGNDSHRGNPHDASDVWNFIRCFWRNGDPITFGDRGSTPGNPPTKFMFPGDPETEQGTGWLDYAEDDRRLLVITGPFTMPVWVDANNNNLPDFGEPGVQEIVAAVIMAQGTDHLNSVTELKKIDELAQLAYDNNFEYKKPPRQPKVQTSEMPNQIILSWDERSEYNEDCALYDSEDIFVSRAIGDTIYVNNLPVIIDDSTYNFYGYNVYQYSDISGSDPAFVASWNIGENKDAKPYTYQRYIILDSNKNPVVGEIDTRLTNGKTYYYGVVAEGFLDFASPKIISSNPAIVSVIPRYTSGIAGFSSQVGDTVPSQHFTYDSTKVISSGIIIPLVIDPSKTTGCDYKITFEYDSIYTTHWNLINTTTGDTILKNQINQRGDDAYTIVDGLMVKVIQPEYDFYSFQCVANANGPIDPPESAAAAWEGFPVPIGVDPDGFVTDGQQAGTGKWFFHTAADYASSAGGIYGSYENFFERSMRGDNMKRAVPYDWEMRFTAEGSWAVRAFEGGKVLNVPFELWCTGIDSPDDPSDDFRLIPWYRSNGGAGRLQTDSTGMTYQLDPNDHPVSQQDNDPYTPWIYWRIPEEHLDYSSGMVGYHSFLAAIDTIAGNEGTYNYGGREVISRSVLVNWNGDDVSDSSVAIGTQMVPEEGTIFRLVTTKPNSPNDYYTFTAPADVAIPNSGLKNDMRKIKVVPNPYNSAHSGETSQLDRWVQFTFLPPKCTVRIFTLSGHLVRTLEKNDPTTPFLRWDLLNEYNVPVGSGIFVYHVEATGIGEKVGKMAIFMSTYRPDTWRLYDYNAYDR